MSSKATYDRGDVVLVPMDLTDRSGSKVRPAVVVSAAEYNSGSPDVLIASITSNRNVVPHPGDHRIQSWKSANLLKPSLLQTKLATVEATGIQRKLGELETEDVKAFDDGLRKALGL